jgi:hypothetical protein
MKTRDRIAYRTPYTKALRWLGKCLPGDYLKSFVYLHCIATPRRLLRRFAGSFYRMELPYEVLKEYKGAYRGPFSILEFGVANGYAFVKTLYATRYLRMEDQVAVHGFDSFEGLRPPGHEDRGLASIEWEAGQYRGSSETLVSYCERRGYRNFNIHKGYFEDTLTDTVLDELKRAQPILVWIDCDYYKSARTVFERLLPTLPNGCVVYFDDYEFNFGTRFTGESRLVYEINHGAFGDGIELVLDRHLSLDTERVYRFIRCDSSCIQYERLSRLERAGKPRAISDGSPLP